MKLQRRDLFRATVAGLLHKVLPAAVASPATEVTLALAYRIRVTVDTLDKRVNFTFDSLFSRNVQ